MNNSRSWLTQGGENPNYHEISFIRDGLALTNLKPPNQPDILKKHGIRSILSLYQPSKDDLDLSAATTGWASVDSLRPIEILIGEGDAPHPRLLEVGVKRRVMHAINDDGTNSKQKLIRAVELLSELHSRNSPVLVHCRLGASRTPAVVACYLAKKDGISFREAVNEIARIRSVAIAEELAITITNANGVELE